MKEHILITTATGKTGYATTVQLLEAGYPVRIFVRSRNEKARQLEKLGAEIALGELTDYKQLREALTGIQRVYYCHPFVPGMVGNTNLFIQAARESGIEAIIYMGQWLAEFENQTSRFTNDTKAAYRQFEESGLNVIYFIPGYFAENTFVVVLEFAVQLGLLPSPFGEGKNPVVSNEDMAAVLAALLKNPTPYYGKRLHPTGPESLSVVDMANSMSRVVGKRIRPITIPEWMFLKAASLMGREFGIDTFQISQARHYNKQYQQNRFDVGGPTDIVRQLTGKEPDNFETIVRRYIDQSPYAKPSWSGWFNAMKKFMTIPFQPIPSIKELDRLNQ